MTSYFLWSRSLLLQRTSCFVLRNKNFRRAPTKVDIIECSWCFAEKAIFQKNSPFETSLPEVFHNKGVPKQFSKNSRKINVPASLFQWSCMLQVEKKLWCRCVPVNFKRLFSRTCTNCWFWYLGISLRRDIFCKVHMEEMNSLLQDFGIHSF